MSMEMSAACKFWAMNSEHTISFADEGMGKHWIHADEPDCVEHLGLCDTSVELQSQAATNVTVEEDWFAYGISQVKERKTPSDCLKLPIVGYGLAGQEQPDLTKSALKGSFFCESNRSNSLWSSYSSKLSVVSEDKPWDSSSPLHGSQDDRSSLSSLSSSGESSPCSFEDASEVQSRYKGPLANMCSLEEALPCKRGLSGFFAGKSRSFSCLADVTSVKDLVKPENVHARKRKFVSACIGNGDRSRAHLMRSRAPGASKKHIPSSKYTVALAVALSMKEGESETRFPSNAAPSRSYSLSDLQGVGNRCSA